MNLLKYLFLYPISLLYSVVIILRNYLYRTKKLKSTKFEFPIICIGNLSTGGTGKTPHVNYLIQTLQSEYNMAVLSRGYKRKTNGYIEVQENSSVEQVGDEPLLFKWKYPKTKVAVCEDRVFGISKMAQNEEIKMVYLLDDAFQHRAIKAGLNILITDYNKLYTKDKMLPLGRLREPINGAKRADIIIVSKCPSPLSTKEKNAIKQELKLKKYQYLYFSSVQYQNLYPLLYQENITIEKNHTVLLISGIANPKPLIKKLENDYSEVYMRKFSDHHQFEISDIESIIRTYENIDAKHKIIITTEKDATRLLPYKSYFVKKQINIYCLPIQVQFQPEEKEAFNKAIKHYLSITLPTEIESTKFYD